MIKKGHIYKITNNINNKSYVGQTTNLQKRKKTHLRNLRNNKHINRYLQNAFNKYGESAFNFEIIESCEGELLNDREMHYINTLNSKENGYNLTLGGEGTRGYKVSKETKLKISEAKKGKKLSDEHVNIISRNSKKNWENPEYREKQRLHMLGNQYNKGRKLSEERKEEISKQMKGRPITDKHKEKLRELYKGEKSITAKLTEEQVIEIRLRFLNGERQYMIAKDYPVSRQTIYDIVRNRRWQHVPNTIKELEELGEV